MYRYSPALFDSKHKKTLCPFYHLDHIARLFDPVRLSGGRVPSAHSASFPLPGCLLLLDVVLLLPLIRPGHNPVEEPDLNPHLTLTLKPTDRPERFSPVHLKRSTVPPDEDLFVEVDLHAAL